VAIVKALLQKGAAPDGNGSPLNGAYPLIAATENDHTEAVRVLLEAGASANVERTNWSTLKTQSALQMAQSKNFAEIVLLLKQHGARK
jgi:ankyrin repeat protein